IIFWGTEKGGITVDIGKRLKIARNAIGYTLERASQESGIGQSSINEFEHNKREPKFSQLSKLADIYKKKIEFFLKDKPIIEKVVLWRDKPSTEGEKKQTEEEFYQLCERYRDLEILMDEIRQPELSLPDITEPEKFDYDQAELFAKKVQEKFRLGDVPIASLKQILEEMYYIKIFYLNFPGSAVSTVSEEFGPAILLNAKNKQWRRSYDLAHELFHLLTWDVFRLKTKIESDHEHKLANAFASRLLMPEESIKDKVKERVDDEGRISLDQLDDIAREFDVSLMALIYRIATVFRFRKEETERYRNAAEKYMKFLRPRESYEPNELPERYCDLALRALREGKLSLMQFAKYMGISYRKAEEYLTDGEDFTDEKISIFVA
ncbi:MAG: helix-turn-helix domain-containing protein, partial [Planctomycetota bacterium]